MCIRFAQASPFHALPPDPRSTSPSSGRPRLRADPPSQFAQELLSTFSTSLGEVALQPATGGVFTVAIVYATSTNAAAPDGGEFAGDVTVQSKVLWDRKADGGFPGTWI